MQPKMLPKIYNFCTPILKKNKKSIQNLPVPTQKRFDAVLGVWKCPNPIFDPLEIKDCSKWLPNISAIGIQDPKRSFAACVVCGWIIFISALCGFL